MCRLKFEELLLFCEHRGIKTKPEKIENLWIVPLFSWYDSSLEGHEKLSKADADNLKGWSDLIFCKWPKDYLPIKLYEKNEEFLSSLPKFRDAPVITFSHMVPRRDLLPPKAYLNYKFLPYVMGSVKLEEQIRSLNPIIHCYGHSHITGEWLIDGIRYVQNAMGYPRERLYRNPKLKQIWPIYND